jgi:hypothetical protein
MLWKTGGEKCHRAPVVAKSEIQCGPAKIAAPRPAEQSSAARGVWIDASLPRHRGSEPRHRSSEPRHYGFELRRRGKMLFRCGIFLFRCGSLRENLRLFAAASQLFAAAVRLFAPRLRLRSLGRTGSIG